MRHPPFRSFLFSFLAGALFVFTACEEKSWEPDNNPFVGYSQSVADSRASAAVTAAAYANESAPDSPAKTAVASECEVALSIMPAPSEKDKLAALERVNLVLRGQVGEYKKLYADEKTENKIIGEARAIERAEYSKENTVLKTKYTEERLTVVCLRYAGAGVLFLTLSAALLVVSFFVSDVPKVATPLRLSSFALTFFGILGGSLPFLWSSGPFQYVVIGIFILGAFAGGYFIFQTIRGALANKTVVKESLEKTADENYLLRDTLKLVAGQIDEFKVQCKDAAKILTEKFTDTLDSDNEALIKAVRAENLATKP